MMVSAKRKVRQERIGHVRRGRVTVLNGVAEKVILK